jgi:hypothetical protein
MSDWKFVHEYVSARADAVIINAAVANNSPILVYAYVFIGLNDSVSIKQNRTDPAQPAAFKSNTVVTFLISAASAEQWARILAVV